MFTFGRCHSFHFKLHALFQKTLWTLTKVPIVVLLMPTGIYLVSLILLPDFFPLYFFTCIWQVTKVFPLNEPEMQRDRCTDHVNAKGTITLMKDNVLGRKSIWIMWIANVLAMFPFKYTCVCLEITSQEAVLAAGQGSYENGILDTGQMACGFMHQLPPTFPSKKS